MDRRVEDWRWAEVAKHEQIARRARRECKSADASRGSDWRSLARWHEGRARTLTRWFEARRDECGAAGGPWIELACSKCGVVHAMPVRCGLRQWCRACQGARAGGLRKRFVRSFGRAQREARIAWNENGAPKGMRPELTLVTLTIRHSGDLRLDRDRLQRGWVRLRAWLQREILRGYPDLEVLQKAWEKRRAWMRDEDPEAAAADESPVPTEIRSPSFVRVWEATKGRDGLGHVHAHVVALWPKMDLRRLDEEWKRATDGEGVNVDVVGPNGRGAHPRRRRTRIGSVYAATEYVTKYASKGVDPRDLDVPTAAAWVQAMHARRMVSTSRSFLAAADPAPTKCEHPECREGVLLGPSHFHRDGWGGLDPPRGENPVDTPPEIPP